MTPFHNSLHNQKVVAQIFEKIRANNRIIKWIIKWKMQDCSAFIPINLCNLKIVTSLLHGFTEAEGRVALATGGQGHRYLVCPTQSH